MRWRYTAACPQTSTHLSGHHASISAHMPSISYSRAWGELWRNGLTSLRKEKGIAYHTVRISRWSKAMATRAAHVDTCDRAVIGRALSACGRWWTWPAWATALSPCRPIGRLPSSEHGGKTMPSPSERCSPRHTSPRRGIRDYGICAEDTERGVPERCVDVEGRSWCASAWRGTRGRRCWLQAPDQSTRSCSRGVWFPSSSEKLMLWNSSQHSPKVITSGMPYLMRLPAILCFSGFMEPVVSPSGWFVGIDYGLYYIYKVSIFTALTEIYPHYYETSSY